MASGPRIIKREVVCPECGYDRYFVYMNTFECASCNQEYPRERRQPARTAERFGVKVTQRQAQAIDYAQEHMIAKHERYSDRKYEVKSIEVSPCGDHPICFAVIEVGMVGDEGTYGEIFNRDRRHFEIGPRGAMTLLNSKSGAKVTVPAVYWTQTR